MSQFSTNWHTWVQQMLTHLNTRANMSLCWRVTFTKNSKSIHSSVKWKSIITDINYAAWTWDSRFLTPVEVRCVNVCCLKWVTALSVERRSIHSLAEKLPSDVMQAFSVCACCFTSQIYLKISDTHTNKARLLFPHTCLMSASAFLMRQARMTGDWIIITQHEFM